ncbi:MAG: DUF262 domain-containing protein [Methanosarcina barkeri]|nr:DUF262 domain-containing protein [Methanosarcina sp. ERenArc_MAG2]
MEISDDRLIKIQEIAKERTVRTQSIEYDLETLVKKIDNKLIKLDPGYQRRHRWNIETSSRLIESLILNIPIPLIYLSIDVDVDVESEESRYSIIDGQQRLTAICDFFNNKYSLKGLQCLNLLNDFKYQDLPSFLNRRLEERTIKCLRIDSTLDSKVKIDIFERLNSGSVVLVAQELRNAVCRGPFNELCKNLSENSNFRKLLQINENELEQNSKVQKMEDVELVLRFYALINNKYKEFKKSKDFRFRDFLTEQLDNGNAIDEKALKDFEYSFSKTMQVIIENFGPIAFAKYKFENNKFTIQSKFNAAVYDSLAIGIYSEVISKNRTIDSSMKDKFFNLFKNERLFIIFWSSDFLSYHTKQ